MLGNTTLALSPFAKDVIGLVAAFLAGVGTFLIGIASVWSLIIDIKKKRAETRLAVAMADVAKVAKPIEGQA